MAITKPTKDTDWATDGAALTTPTTISRKELGWQTLPDNLAGQPGEKPNLNQQNFWQLAVHEWKTYFETTTDDLNELTTPTVVEIIDLWEWDIDDLTEFNVGGNDQLRFDCESSQSGTNSDFTAGNHTECDYIGYWFEFIENFNRGVGIQIIDNSDDVYDILPVAGATGIWLTNEIELTGRQGINDTDATIEIQVDVSSAKLEVYKNGVLSDFSNFDFSFADRAAIDAKNPNGFRAILRATPEVNFKYNEYTLKPLFRKRYRMMQGLRSNSGWDVSTNAAYDFTCRFEEGVTYNIHYNWILEITNTPNIAVYSNDSTKTVATMIDMFAIQPAAAGTNNQGSSNSLFTEVPFQRYTQFTARDSGSGLTHLSFLMSGATAELAHNNDPEFNGYTNLSEMSVRPIGLNSYVVIEG